MLVRKFAARCQYNVPYKDVVQQRRCLLPDETLRWMNMPPSACMYGTPWEIASMTLPYGCE
jgi:hypothetical protein